MQEQPPSTHRPLSFWLPWIQTMWCRPPLSLSSVRHVLQGIVITFSQNLTEDKQRWSLMGDLFYHLKINFCPLFHCTGWATSTRLLMIWALLKKWLKGMGPRQPFVRSWSVLCCNFYNFRFLSFFSLQLNCFISAGAYLQVIWKIRGGQNLDRKTHVPSWIYWDQ